MWWRQMDGIDLRNRLASASVSVTCLTSQPLVCLLPVLEVSLFPFVLQTLLINGADHVTLFRDPPNRRVGN